MTNFRDKAEKYKALVDAVRYLNSSMKSEEVLRTLLVKSIELIDNADTGLIFIYNKETKYLEVKSSYGFDATAYSIVIRPGESITGKAFSENKTIAVNGVKNVKEQMRSISFYKQLGKTADEFLGKKLSTIKGAIACPINIKDECIGVLVVDNFTNNTDFTKMDVEILEIISIQAALSIENARNFELTEKNNKSLNAYSKIVEAERNKYRYTTQLHNRFTKMVLNGASIHDLISELSDLISSDIIYIDSYGNIIEQSLQRFLDENQIHEVYTIIKKHLANTSIRQVMIDTLAFRVQPVLVEKENLGWLVIIQKNESYSVEDEITIDRGITILALEILKQRQLYALEEKYRGDFIDTLITNQSPETIDRYSNEYRINFSMPHRLILIDFYDKSPIQNNSKLPHKINKIVSYCNQYISRAIAKKSNNYFVTNKLRTIFVIIPEHSLTRHDIQVLLEELFQHKEINTTSRILDVRMAAIVSESFIGSSSFGTIYSNNQRVLHRLCEVNKHYQWGFYEDSKIKRILLHGSEEELKSFLIETLDPLLGSKKSHRDLLNTLRIYIRSNGNWTYTKDTLFIHGNTLTQRLKRICQLLNYDLNDYYDRLHIQLALEILDLYPESLDLHPICELDTNFKHSQYI
ncbi:helix-turn-helix domain-containing protein [Natronincola ferrireducens]|uniref:Sugar diacid utilization regulator n=1 Tax=Natronincola ferrireducens TaxID=393762 RepID=A0A1G9A4Y5_9FIRM|nr:helix-turn-helix domain-containing protein [Natronincola ferrireducens]SDK21914.1 Sugar diacid utilization regulator [Natronincola ferrireducens]